MENIHYEKLELDCKLDHCAWVC